MSQVFIRVIKYWIKMAALKDVVPCSLVEVHRRFRGAYCLIALTMKAVDALMVIVLDIGPKVRGFKPERGNGFLKAIKICSMPPFGGEVKPSAPCRKILGHIRSHFQMNFWSSAGEWCVEEKIQP
jgi:hypothetical protein